MTKQLQTISVELEQTTALQLGYGNMGYCASRRERPTAFFYSIRRNR